MALFFADLVREACWDAGAGDLALGGALPGHQAFADAVPEGARFHYAIRGVTHPEEWETGEGEIVAGQLARTPGASSAAGDAVAFAAGLKTVALTVNASWFEARGEGVAAIGDVGGLAEALAGKAPVSHHHDGAYQPLNSGLSAIAALDTTSFGRAQLTLADAAGLRGHAGLGSVAVRNVGTSGDVVPLLSGGATTWAGGAVFGGVLRGTGSIEADGAVSSVLNLRVASAAEVQMAAFAGHVFDLYADTHRFRSWGGAMLMTLGADGQVAIGGSVAIGGNQIIAARRTGWAAASGTAARGSFDTAGATTEALAQRLKALIDDLIAHGLIGA